MTLIYSLKTIFLISKMSIINRYLDFKINFINLKKLILQKYQIYYLKKIKIWKIFK